MDKLSNEQIKAIKADAAKNHDGDLDLAIVNHLEFGHAAARCGGQVPAFLKTEVATIKGAITKADNEQKKAAAKPKKRTR